MLDKDREEIERLHEAERRSKKKYSNIRKKEKWLDEHPKISDFLEVFIAFIPLFLFLFAINISLFFI